MTAPLRFAAAALALALPSASRPSATAERSLVAGSQDVLADRVQIPARNETAFGIGRHDRISNVTSVEPRFVTLVSERLGLAHQFRLPLVWQPEVVARYGGTYGIGDISYDLYATAPVGERLALGGGLATVLPTGSDRRISESKWLVGPALALSTSWGSASFAVTARQLFTLGSVHTAPDVNRLVVQPSLAWALRSGWFLLTAPKLQADWDRGSADRFTIPLGGGAGRIVSVGSQRLALTLEAYGYAAPRSSTPHPDWSIRAGASLLFTR